VTKYEPKIPYYHHQKSSLVEAYPHEEHGFIFEPGCGKSKTFIDDMGIHFEYKGLQLGCVIAPKGVYDNWYHTEIPRHMPDRIRERTMVHLWRGGGTKTEQRQLDYLLEEPRPGYLKVLIMNTEAVSMSTRAWDILRRFVGAGRCMIGVDESSKIKNADSIISKRLLGTRKETGLRDISIRTKGWRRIMTGTPATKSYMDLWAQYEFLQDDYFRTGSFFGFRARYAEVKMIDFRKQAQRDADAAAGRKGHKVPVIEGYRNIDELLTKMRRHASIWRKADCLDLPPKIGGVSDPNGPRLRKVTWTDEQARMYTDLVDFATAEISPSQHVTVTHVLTKMLRLHQILSGITVSDDGVTSYIGTNLPNALQEELEESSGQSIIWCRYRHDIDVAGERLRKMGRSFVEYHGGTSADDRRRAIDDFQAGRVDDFLGTVDTGGMGITLTAASSVIYYTCWYNLEKRLQSEDRPHRIGQTKSVTYTDLVHEGTVNMSIMARLCAQQEMAATVMVGRQAVRDMLTGAVDIAASISEGRRQRGML
jgi:hypothetical protein